MKPKSPLLLPITLSLLFVVILAVTVSYFQSQINSLTSRLITPTPSSLDISTWQTYRNDKYGFEFQYSADYFKYQQESDAGIYLAPSAGQGGNGPKFLTPNDVWLNTEQIYYANTTSIDKFIDSEPSFYINAQKSPITIDGAKGYKITYDFPAVSGDIRNYSSEALVSKNNKLYKITLSAWNQSNLQNFQTDFDQILSTFRFIIPIPTPTPAWLIYTVSQINLQFKYPENNWTCSKNSYPVQEGSSVSIRPGEPCDCGMSIQWYDNPKGLSPREYWIQKEKDATETFESINCDGDICKINRNAGSPETKYTNVYKFENVTVAGKPAVKVNVVEELYSIGRIDDGVYLQSNNGKIIWLNYCPDATNTKILSTFKFIN